MSVCRNRTKEDRRRTREINMVLASFGSVHNTIHGDGDDVIGRVVKTTEEMLLDRGCTSVTRQANVYQSITEGGFEPILRGRGGGHDVDVHIHNEDKVGIKFVRALLNKSDDALILISKDGPTPFTKKNCDGERVQFFNICDLCVNVTHHALVPRHERAQPPDGIESDKLPKIFDTDPVAQYFNWPVGTVIRVMRVFGGDEPIPYYRIVASG